MTGCWDDGFALDTYIVRSIPRGINEHGYLTFDNTYSPIGELLHSMKYNGHIDTSKEILDLAIPFLNDWFLNVSIDVALPVPPTQSRELQPTFAFAEKLANHYKFIYTDDLLIKTSNVQAKNMSVSERNLDGAISITNKYNKI